MGQSSTTFEVMGRPVPKARARGGRNGFYTPARTKTYETRVAATGRKHFTSPHECAVKVSMWFTFTPAKSWSKKKTAEHMSTFHQQKPDLDNLEKSILDALNGIAYDDDKRVAWVEKRKVWGPTGKVVVTVEPLEWRGV